MTMSEDRILEKLDALAESLSDVRERLARLEAREPSPPSARASAGGVAAGGAVGAAVVTLVQFLVHTFGG